MSVELNWARVRYGKGVKGDLYFFSVSKLTLDFLRAFSRSSRLLSSSEAGMVGTWWIFVR